VKTFVRAFMHNGNLKQSILHTANEVSLLDMYLKEHEANFNGKVTTINEVEIAFINSNRLLSIVQI